MGLTFSVAPGIIKSMAYFACKGPVKCPLCGPDDYRDDRPEWTAEDEQVYREYAESLGEPMLPDAFDLLAATIDWWINKWR